MRKIPELLAPAGGPEQLKAAVENGADAVYMGGKLFNARINADNFSDEEMRSGIEYARMRGVKTHVTMNTLLSDKELYDGLKNAEKLYEYGVDAIIVQELSLGRLIKTYIPDLDIHLSTQGTVYNIEGVKKAKELGFSRVVLARELSLEEIKAIADENLLELEVFIHGALCVCYSGQCQMSREIGGRSGNRGSCAQPCRLPYSIYEENDGIKKKLTDPFYALSPKDLCTVEHLDKLAETGVDSLKIEGRMKSPEYVAIVTGIYRKYLDQYKEKGKYKVEDRDLEALLQIFSRGGFTNGYLFSNPGKSLMSGELPKHQGIYIGKVLNGFANKRRKEQKGLVSIKLYKHLALGDIIEIRNKSLISGTVTFIKKGSTLLQNAGNGDSVLVGDIKGAIYEGDKVFKIVDKSLMSLARRSYTAQSSVEEKNFRKVDINFKFAACLGQPVILHAADNDGNTVTKELIGVAGKALNKPITKDVVEAQLKKTGGTPFHVKDCQVNLDEGIALPLRKVNELRRLTLEELEQKRLKTPKKLQILDWQFTDLESQKLDINEPSVSDKETHSLYLWNSKELTNNKSAVDRIYLPYDKVLQYGIKCEKNIIPVIPNVTRGWHDNNIRKKFNAIVELSRMNGICVGNLGWIEPFTSAGVDVYGDYGLNLHNSRDFYLASELGLKGAIVSHEATIEEICNMNFHGVVPEVVIGGRIPVMISEHCIIGDLQYCPNKEKGRQDKLKNIKSCTMKQYLLKSQKGEFFPIKTDSRNCQSIIFSYKDFKSGDRKKMFKDNGINCFRTYRLE